MKKTISLICALLAVLLIFPACSKPQPEPEVTEYEVNVSSSSLDQSRKMQFFWSPDRILTGDCTVYDYDIAQFAFLAVLDAHDNALVKLPGSTADSDTANYAFLSGLGFENIKEYKVASTDGIDTCDTTGMQIGTLVKDESAIITISFLGTATDDEWASNLDIGSSAAEYEQLTGSHPDWKNKSNHKGYDVAVNRAVRIIENYCESAVPDGTKNVSLVITGYSRGAAIANILGAMAEKKQFSVRGIDYKSRAITFATPFSTDAPDAKTYKTVFNFINNDDIVTMLPPTVVGMTRYGTDITGQVRGTENEAAFAKDTGKTYTVPTYSAAFISGALNDICFPRDKFYTIDDSEGGTVVREFATVAEAEADREATVAALTSLGVIGYCRISEVRQNGDKFAYTNNFSNAFITSAVKNVLPKISSEGLAGISDYLTYILCPKISGSLLKLNTVDGNSITNAHYPFAYIYILEGTKK